MRRTAYTSEDAALPTTNLVRGPELRAHGLRLRVTSGPNAGLSVTLPAALALVGRSPAAELRLTDPAVSSFHLELKATPTGVEVVDLESSNGTYYQGARLDRGAVSSGATLQIGASTLCVELDTAEEKPADELASFGALRGESVVTRELFGLLARLARTELSILLEGPTGVGKELAARAIHETSQHASGPFVVLDCTAIPPTLAESVLFGHEKGAFTGATERRPGIFEAAGEGTVFLDEVGELLPELQAKLLRVLERREVVRVGSVKPHPILARVLSATWRDLRARVNGGSFREDLYYRVTQARVVIPPLSARRDDIPLLVRHFLACLPSSVPCARSITDEALSELVLRDFPGNVRELKNTVERAAMTAAGAMITSADLAFERMLAGEADRGLEPSRASLPPPAPADGAQPVAPFKEAKRTLIDEFERQYLENLLARAGDNLSRAAALARIERHYLRELLRRHGLRGEE